MDEHEFTAKMEAFALHGLKGSIQLIINLSFFLMGYFKVPLSITSKQYRRSAQPSATRSTNNFVSPEFGLTLNLSHVIQQVSLLGMKVRRWNGSITGGR